MATIRLKPVEATDADELFPMVHRSSVTDTLVWDGPTSLEGLRDGLVERERQVREGARHQFTIVENATGKKIGSIDIRPFEDGYRGDIGVWVGHPFQGKGYGTEAVRQILEYGFEKLQMEKIEAKVFLGNSASRRTMEKVGFQLEGTIRKGAKKQGEFLDEWLFGIIREEFSNSSRDE